MIECRPMLPSEAADVLELALRSFQAAVASDFTPEGVREFERSARWATVEAAPGHEVSVAVEDGRLLGMIDLRECAHVALFFVDSAEQRRGIGRRLLDCALARCLKRPGLESITVNSSRFAIPAYERLGFSATGPETEQQGIISTPMEKRLAAPLGEPWDAVHSRAEWRAWLAEHHGSAAEAWIVIHKRGPLAPLLTLADAQEEALCFGWVDVSNRRVDALRYGLRFTPRRPGSQWSASNVVRVERLAAEGLMTPAGTATVEEAKRNGQWEIALRIEQVDLVPPALERALREHTGAIERYLGLSRSRRRQLLRAILGAKTERGRESRVAATVREALGEE